MLVLESTQHRARVALGTARSGRKRDFQQSYDVLFDRWLAGLRLGGPIPPRALGPTHNEPLLWLVDYSPCLVEK
jgi:hypothetical protein